jgi:hypothetical protein
VAFELGVDLALLGLGVGDQQVGELRPPRHAVLLAVAERTEQALELAVVGEDQLDDVLGVGGVGAVGQGVGHNGLLVRSRAGSLAPPTPNRAAVPRPDGHRRDRAGPDAVASPTPVRG